MLALACAPTDPWAEFPELAEVGPNVRFAAQDPDAEICGGTFAYLQGYTERLAALHGVGDDVTVDIYWTAGQAGIAEARCGAVACTNILGETVTPLLPHEHELVHAVRSELGLSQFFLEEGAAELWAGHRPRDPDTDLDVIEAIAAGANDDNLPLRYYGVAGMFSAFLAQRYDPEAVARVGAATSIGDDVEAVDAALRATLGLGLSEAASQFDATDFDCDTAAYRDGSISCELAVALDCGAEVDGNEISTTIDPSCASASTVGAVADMFWTEIAFDVTENRNVRILVSAAEQQIGRVRLLPCSPGCAHEPGADSIAPNQEAMIQLQAGRYILRIEPHPVSGALEPIAVTISNNCVG